MKSANQPRRWVGGKTFVALVITLFFVGLLGYFALLPTPGEKLSSVILGSPGSLDIGGTWLYQTGFEEAWLSLSANNDGGWQTGTLTADWQALGLADLAGTVSFRRRVELKENWSQQLAPNGLGILVGGGQGGTYRVFAGKEEIGTSALNNGKVPIPRPHLFPIPSAAVSAEGQLQILLTFDRRDWDGGLRPTGGPVGEILVLGDLKSLERLQEMWRQRARSHTIAVILLIGLLATLSLYHLQLYWNWRQEREFLWLGLLALVMATLCGLNYLAVDLFAGLAWRKRCSVFLSHGAILIWIEYLTAFLGFKRGGRWLRFYQVSHGLLAVLAVLWPVPGWLFWSRPWRWLWTLPVFVGSVGLLLPQVRKEKAEAGLIALASLVLPLSGLAYGAMLFGGVEGGLLLPALSTAGLGILKAVAVSNRFSRLNAELDELRLRLEQRVEDHTDELSSANRRLRSEIAERQLVEEALRMLERAVEQSIDGIAVMDLAGSSQFLNEAWAKMHGHEVFEVLGYDLTLFHTTEQMQGQVYPLMKQVREQGAFHGEVGHRRKDGSVFPTWMSFTLLQDEADEPVGMVAIARDITERRRVAEEQLRLETKAQQAEKLASLAILASGIAHDYNNLLTGVLGNADLLLEELPVDSAESEKLRQVVGAAERAAQLSDQLLAYAGEEQSQPETLDLNTLIRSMVSELEKAVAGRAVLKFQLNADLPAVDIDPNQFRIILFNLVRNGVESLQEQQGVITLRSSMVQADAEYFRGAVFEQGQGEGAYAIFEVSDSGSGIDVRTRNRMFDPFFSTKGKGRGLGLAATLGIVRSHRGAIKVHSQPRKGTTFEVLFPASDQVPAEIDDVVEISERYEGQGTILVIDDEELVRDVAHDILQAYQFEVLLADSGESGVELFRNRRFDIRLVLLDLTMEGMDGEQVYDAIHQLSPHIPVVLMSGYSQRRARSRLEAEGLSAFIHKPFRPDELIRVIRGVLG